MSGEESPGNCMECMGLGFLEKVFTVASCHKTVNSTYSFEIPKNSKKGVRAFNERRDRLRVPSTSKHDVVVVVRRSRSRKRCTWNLEHTVRLPHLTQIYNTRLVECVKRMVWSVSVFTCHLRNIHTWARPANKEPYARLSTSTTNMDG